MIRTSNLFTVLHSLKLVVSLTLSCWGLLYPKQAAQCAFLTRTILSIIAFGQNHVPPGHHPTPTAGGRALQGSSGLPEPWLRVEVKVLLLGGGVAWLQRSFAS